MTVHVTGPEGSGTRMLTALIASVFGMRDWYEVREWGEDVVMHHPMPGLEAGFWDTTDPENVGPDPRFVVIQRRPDVTQLSLLQKHYWDGGLYRPLRETWTESRDKWREAVRVLAAVPDAHWISYEALVADPAVQVRTLGKWLGREPDGPWPEVRDENAKWLSFLERPC